MNNGFVVFTKAGDDASSILGVGSTSQEGGNGSSHVNDGSNDEVFIAIPVLKSNEPIELTSNDLMETDPQDIVSILQDEKAPPLIWLEIATEYYRRGKPEVYTKVVESGLQYYQMREEEARAQRGRISYASQSESIIPLLCSIALFNTIEASRLKEKGMNAKQDEKIEKLMKSAKEYLDQASRVNSYDSGYRAAYGIYLMLDNKLDDALREFDNAIKLGVSSVAGTQKSGGGGGEMLAYIGKANIAFRKGKYKDASDGFKTVISLYPGCPSSVRVGLGLCFYHMGNTGRAYECFDRALELNPSDVDALVSLAIIEIGLSSEVEGLGTTTAEIAKNQQIARSLRTKAEAKLQKAYAIDGNNSLVLTHLANRFFLQKDRDYQKIDNMLHKAFDNTSSNKIRAEIRYALGRNAHAQAAEAAQNGDVDKMDRMLENANKKYEDAQMNWDTFPLLRLVQIQMMVRGSKPNIHGAEQKLSTLRNDPEFAEDEDFMLFHAALSAEKGSIQEALTLLRRVTDKNPENVEAWVLMAQLEQGSASKTSIEQGIRAYTKLLQALKGSGKKIPPELNNNIGVLYYRSGDLQKSVNALEAALKTSYFIHKGIKDDPSNLGDDFQDDKYRAENVTTAYNLARVYEAMARLDDAEVIHKAIIDKYPNYIDSRLRLGCIARDRGQMHDAEEIFKEACHPSTLNPDAWTLLANLQLKRGEKIPAMKKFNQITKTKEYKHDPYAWLAIANDSLDESQSVLKTDKKSDEALRAALGIYRVVISRYPKNLYAANGIGSVMSLRGTLTDARRVFERIREVADTAIPEAWVNLAHVWMEQGSYDAAATLYQQCLKRFYGSHDIDITLYLALAYFLSDKYTSARTTLLRGLRHRPNDLVLWFNLALVEEYEAIELINTIESSSQRKTQVVNAMNLLKHSLSLMEWLGEKKPSSTSSSSSSKHGSSSQTASSEKKDGDFEFFLPHEPQSPPGSPPDDTVSEDTLRIARANRETLLAPPSIAAPEKNKSEFVVAESEESEKVNESSDGSSRSYQSSHVQSRSVKERAASAKPFSKWEIAKNHAEKLKGYIKTGEQALQREIKREETSKAQSSKIAEESKKLAEEIKRKELEEEERRRLLQEERDKKAAELAKIGRIVRDEGDGGKGKKGGKRGKGKKDKKDKFLADDDEEESEEDDNDDNNINDDDDDGDNMEMQDDVVESDDDDNNNESSIKINRDDDEDNDDAFNSSTKRRSGDDDDDEVDAMFNEDDTADANNSSSQEASNTEQATSVQPPKKKRRAQIEEEEEEFQ